MISVYNVSPVFFCQVRWWANVISISIIIHFLIFTCIHPSRIWVGININISHRLLSVLNTNHFCERLCGIITSFQVNPIWCGVVVMVKNTPPGTLKLSWSEKQ